MKKLYLPLILLLLIALQVKGQEKKKIKSNNEPYVLLISFDGFRWDYLDRGITPNLDKLINKGVRAISFRPAFPSKTFPNHLSIITGMYPENHGIILNKFENPNTGKVYKLSDRKEVANPVWYLGEPFWTTAMRNGIRTASFFWPASSMKGELHHPNIFKKYDGKVNYYSRVDTIAAWLKMPADTRPHFLTLYYSLTDTYGHHFGPNSKEINVAISKLDSVTGYLITKLKQINMFDSLNIIVLSDHGMTDISPERVINIQKMLPAFDLKIEGSGPVMMISTKQEDEVYRLLKKNQNHFKVFKKSEIPDYYFFNSNPFISNIILVADLGWSLVDNQSVKSFVGIKAMKGNHGYAKDALDMHGIFIAEGPAFKNGFKTGTIWNIDVYPLLCKIFNISPRSNIDGKISRIDFIMNDKLLKSKN